MANPKYLTPAHFCVTCETQKTSEDFYVSNKRHCKKCLLGKYKRKYRSHKHLLIAQGKLLRVMQMTLYLAKGRFTLDEFAQRWDISTRTARRYLHLIETLDFGLEQDFQDRYFLVHESCPLCGRKHEEEEHLMKATA